MKKGILALVVFAAALAASGELSKYKDWPKSPEAYFLTPLERGEWINLTSDDDAEKFIALYWAKRGGEPFKAEISRRIAAADQQFKLRRYDRGAVSNRGRLLVVLGSPNKQQRENAPQVPGNTVGSSALAGQADITSQAANLNLTWWYDKDRFPADWGIGELRVRIIVDQVAGTDELQAGGTTEKAIAMVAEKSIINPTGKPAALAAAAPRPAAPAPAAAPAAAPAVPPPALATANVPAAARSILEAANASKEKKVPEGSFWGSPFRTLAGDPFYAFELTLPADKAVSGLKFGGVVLAESGEEKGSYWEDAVFLDSKTGTAVVKVFIKSLTLPAGSYRGSFGVFPVDGGTALVSASPEFKIEPAPEGLEVSPLIMTNILTPFGKRAPPMEPFIFGKVEKPIQIIPKANHLFMNQDGLWYFYTVRNPARAADAPAPADAGAGKAPTAPGAPAAAADAPRPRVMTTISVLRNGKPAFQPVTAPAELDPFGSDFYGEGKEIPLEKFEPGYYTFVLGVRDLNAPRDSAPFKGFERRSDFVVLKADGSMPDKPAPDKPAPAKAPAKKG